MKTIFDITWKNPFKRSRKKNNVNKPVEVKAPVNVSNANSKAKLKNGSLIPEPIKGSKKTEPKAKPKLNVAPSVETSTPIDAKYIFSNIVFIPTSVVGETGMNTKKLEYKGDVDELSTTAIVDAAGLPYFIGQKDGQNKKGPIYPPSGAGGSSESLYKFIGIKLSDPFPKEVTTGIKGIGDAIFHTYNKYHVIHAFGPDFRMDDKILEYNINPDYGFKNFDKTNQNNVILFLTKVYENIFIEFIKNKDKNAIKLNALNIVPISVGIFAGKILNDPATATDVTMKAILGALQQIEIKNQINKLKDTKINLCLWRGKTQIQFYLNKRRELISNPNSKLGGRFKFRSFKKKNKNKGKKKTKILRKYLKM